MKDIVEEALQHADERERQSTDDDPSIDEFRTPVCALVGCGSAGATRVQAFDTHAKTADTGSDTIYDIAETDLSILVRNGTPPKDTGDTDQPAVVATRDAVLEAVDLIAVTADLGDPTSAERAVAVCRGVADDQTVVAVPTIPKEGLSDTSRAIFFELVEAAGTTVPVALSRISDGFCTPDPTTESDPVQRANAVIVAWLEDIFDTVQQSLAAPCRQLSTIYELLNSGAVSMLYWGSGTRSSLPDELLEDAVAHRLCDGNRQTASGGFGFVRFGVEFTLAEFESLETQSTERLCPETVADRRWTLCGNTDPDWDDECRIALLVADIDPASLPFV